MANRVRKWVLVCMLMICVAGLSGIGKVNDGVVIYSSLEEFRNEKLREMLREQLPDIDVTIQYISMNKGAAKIKLEKSRTDADILLAFDIQSLELIKDELNDLKIYDTRHYLDGLNPKHNKYRIWERFAGAIIVNKNLLNKMNMPIPASYEDLTNPIYKDLIAMPDPKSSGTGYFFLKHIVNEWGEERAFEYFDKLHSNIKQYTASGSGPIKLLLQNEIAIGMGMIYQAVDEINKGADLQIIYPPEGAPYSLSGIAMIQNRTDRPEVAQVFDFLYRKFTFYDKENYSPERVFKRQCIKVPHYPRHIKYGNMKGLKSAAIKQDLLRKWKY
ncbi:extracellular solute-binding protein [Paenibacillus apiarius]|uniref:Extracellular solute-binding protein n=1 Tax=Paenibacillus apiarius TaxID=46240 RepID=A0ABT4DSI0_9BACL|nr:extracellular solute-binding protein [Paenibacillus apiarius]MCY9514171.1 extracellular solute-binding protein [Paenibacillus apiarius]MCY9520294.1 extracellular solute-binding protein [Paenibacillus apiarius]MCY9550364.1 extracellular solute-binding protein [Paenibacillus apiarius]MCY9557426.1 extracellular solute-binding protein [Paenibacillus apiarius]MCY9682395.1 extracellular solute-binding protein [Paenibacillus apiarius]